MSARIEQVSTPDGPFDLTVWLPEAGHGPGILLIQEIFGVGDYIRAVAEDLAALGYVVAAPDLFWRLKPGHAAVHDEPGVAESLALGSQFDIAPGRRRRRGRAGPPRGAAGGPRRARASSGSASAVRSAYFLAVRAEVDALVSFYGSEVPGHTELLAQISAPVQFHFGGDDPYIPGMTWRGWKKPSGTGRNAEIHVEEDAGHAFHNRKAPMFHQSRARRPRVAPDRRIPGPPPPRPARRTAAVAPRRMSWMSLSCR